MAEQLLGPPQSPADLDDDREASAACVLDALRQLVNLGAAFLRDAAIVKEGLLRLALIPLGMLWLCWREMPARATSASIGPAEGRCKTGGKASSSVMERHRRPSSAPSRRYAARALSAHRCAADGRSPRRLCENSATDTL